MNWVAGFIALTAVALGFIAIEKKKREGPLTYPLWRVNLFIPWIGFMVLSAVIIGCVSLPRYVSLALHHAQAQGTIMQESHEQRCLFTYAYEANGVAHSNSDILCGARAGEKRVVYYDTENNDNSTLSIPLAGLKYEAIALLLICFCLSSVFMVWFRLSYILGSKIT